MGALSKCWTGPLSEMETPILPGCEFNFDDFLRIPTAKVARVCIVRPRYVIARGREVAACMNTVNIPKTTLTISYHLDVFYTSDRRGLSWKFERFSVTRQSLVCQWYLQKAAVLFALRRSCLATRSRAFLSYVQRARVSSFSATPPSNFLLLLSLLPPRSSFSARQSETIGVNHAMNEHLSERFGRSRRAVKPPPAQAQVWLIPQQLNLKIREYFIQSQKPVDGGAWLSRPEIPPSSEVLDTESSGSHSSSEVAVACNRKKGAWASKG